MGAHGETNRLLVAVTNVYERERKVGEELHDVPYARDAAGVREATRTEQLVLIITPRDRRIFPWSAYHWRAIDEILLLVNLFIESGLIFVIKNRLKVEMNKTDPRRSRAVQAGFSAVEPEDAVGESAERPDARKSSK